MIDMGVKTEKKDMGECCPMPPKEKSDEPRYPEVCFRDEHFDKIKEAIGEMPDVDDELVLTIHVKCSGIRKDSYGNSIDFKITGLDEASGFKPKEGEDEEEDEEPEKESGKKMNPAIQKAMKREKY